MKHPVIRERYMIISHAPHGACGLKLGQLKPVCLDTGHAPHGACGLKLVYPPAAYAVAPSRPARGVWVET